MIGRLLGAVILVIAAIYAYTAYGYEAGYGDPLGPKAFPLMLSVPTIILSLSLSLWPGETEAFASIDHRLKQLGFIIAMLGFAFILEKIGYLFGTIILISIMSMLLNAKPKNALIVGVTIAPILWATFDRFLGLPLPLWGTWIS